MYRHLALVFCLALAPFAAAGDFYVDATLGDDANTGTSPSEAWRTLTHAVATVPSPAAPDVSTIHVAPGTYAASGGEVFPLVMRPRVALSGTLGSAATALDGEGFGGALIDFVADTDNGFAFGPESLVAGLTLRGAQLGVTISSTWLGIDCTLRELHILDMDVAGVRAIAGDFGGAGSMDPLCERVRVEGCLTGLNIAKTGEGGSAGFTLVESVVVDNDGNGVEIRNVSDNGGLSVVIRRSIVEGNGLDGVNESYTNGSGVVTSIEDSSLSDNGADGLSVELDTGLGGIATTHVERSTVAHNGAAGLFLEGGATSYPGHPTTLNSCIVYGNGDDIVELPFDPSITSIEYCDVGDGDYAGTNGNISVDPLFRDPVARDFRLGFGTGCVDGAAPTAAAHLDLSGAARDVDGDLDLTQAPDMGALELHTLAVLGEPSLGTTLTIELAGQAGGWTILYLARGDLLPVPLSTPFGDAFLDPVQRSRYDLLRTFGGTPTTRTFEIRDNPAYVGLDFSFQALTRSDLAPAGGAWSEATMISIVP